jgi:ring-1,2-phenylacetyl-CoA epoxidase subunit PaaB
LSHEGRLAITRGSRDPNHAAITPARAVYTRRTEGVSIWVPRTTEISASTPSDKGPLFDPAEDKVYRHPTFYNIPDEVGNM